MLEQPNLELMNQYGVKAIFQFTQVNNIAQWTIERYMLNRDLDMKDKIYLINPNYLQSKINALMAIPGEIGFTVRMGLFTGLREEDEIRQKLRKPEPLVLVSTQVIEAGVNFDFDVLIRDIRPIDAIVQAAGRCNRNGNRKEADPYYIYRVVKDKDIDREFAKDVYGTISIEIAKSIIKNSNFDPVTLVDSYYDEIKRRKSSEATR
jgi:CRISPR-associated endonuclease/helicase Cas3